MIRWINEYLGTARRDNVDDGDYSVVDVRDLVDREGNSVQEIRSKIDAAADLLKQKHKVIICCDYGISRSNAIAIGILTDSFNYDFNKATELVVAKTGETAINIDLLNSVRRALDIEKKAKNMPNRKKILITGGTGLIGKTLAEKLGRKYDLVMPTRQELNLLEGSINLDLTVKNRGIDIIIHLANPRKYNLTESMGQSLVMLKNVLDVCKENHATILFLSSWAVYSGYNSRRLIAPESLPSCPKGTYGDTKVLCEILLNSYKNSYGLNIYLLRLSHVYGREIDRPRFIYSFFRKALKDETIITHNYLNGSPIVDLIHVDDVTDAIEGVLKVKPVGLFDLNIGSGIGYSTVEIAEIIKELSGSSSKIIQHEINDFSSNVIMDIGKAEKFIGWRPRICLKDGLNQ